MFITSKTRERPTFTAVNYSIFNKDGRLHIGRTLKSYLNHKRITYEELAERINMSKTGVSSMVKRETIDTGRLIQISECLDHDFFKYYTTNLHITDIVSESNVEYERPQPKRKLIIEVEDNRVVNQYESENSRSVQELIAELEKKQERLLEELTKHLPK